MSNNPTTPRVLLTQVPPAPRPYDRRSHKATLTRIARNVATLFALDFQDNPLPIVWASNYDAVTVTDIARGYPSLPASESKMYAATKNFYYLHNRAIFKPTGSPSRNLPDDIEAIDSSLIPAPLATATVYRFGPDTKAALVLCGADTLFQSIYDAMASVIQTLYYNKKLQPIADASRCAIWAALTLQAFKAQPLLFSAAVKARAIQRASLLQSSIQIVEDSPASKAALPEGKITEGASCEITPPSADDTYSPRTLCIFDKLIIEVVRPQITPYTVTESAPRKGQGARHSAVTYSVISRWCHLLLRSSDRPTILLDKGISEHKVQATSYYLSVFPYSNLLQEMLRAMPLQQEPETTCGACGQTELRYFNPRLESDIDLLLPGIPDASTLLRLDETTLCSLVEAHTTLMRGLRHAFTIRTETLLRATRESALKLAEEVDRAMIARAAAPTDFLLRRAQLYARIYAKFTILIDHGAFLKDTALETWVIFLIEDIKALHQQLMAGELDRASWVEIFNTIAPTLRQSLMRCNEELRKENLNLLFHYWREFFGDTLKAKPDNQSKRGFGIELSSTHSLLHNYCGFILLSSENHKEIEETFDLVESLIDSRSIAAAGEKSMSRLRKTYEMVIAAIDRNYSLFVNKFGEAAVSDQLIAIISVLPQLSSRGRETLSVRPYLYRARGIIRLIEAGRFTRDSHGDHALRLLDTAENVLKMQYLARTNKESSLTQFSKEANHQLSYHSSVTDTTIWKEIAAIRRRLALTP